MGLEEAGQLPAKYNLSNTETNLGNNLSVAQEAAKAEMAQEIIDGAVNASSLGSLVVTYSLLDSLANIYQADPEVVAGARSYSLTTTSVNLTPATTVAATATTLAALQDVIDGAVTGKGPLQATYSLADTLANLSNPASAGIVEGTTAWTLTDAAGNLGTLTQEQAAVVAGATNAASYTYNTAFTLTSEPDTVTLADNVQVFDAPKVYNPGGTDLINSLQNEDNLTANTQGGTQATSLSADLGNPNDSGDFLINPIMNNIETLNIAFTNTSTVADREYLQGYDSNGMTLDLEDTAGTNTVNMTRITGGNRASIINMDGQEVSAVSVSNSSAQSQALFTFLNSTLGEGEVNTLEVGLNNASLYDRYAFIGEDGEPYDSALAISSTDPQGSEYQEGIEEFNITVGGTRTSTVATFDTGNTDYDDIVPGELPQTLNITANQGLDIGTFRWLSNRVENVSATESGFLNDSNHNVYENGLGLTRAGQINTITASGAGNITLANVGSFESVLDADDQVDFTLNAAGLMGNLTADITNASSSTDTSTSITGGGGTNRFYVANQDVRTSVSAGAGSNDSLTVQSNDGQTVNLRAGTGIETLNLVGADYYYYSLWDVDLSNGGFELVTINNQQTSVGGGMSVYVEDADVANTVFSIRSQGLDNLDQPLLTGTQPTVGIDIAQAATATGDTLTLHLGEVESDQSSTNAFSWKNFTNNVVLYDSSAAAVAIDNLDFQINSAGLVGATPAPVNLTLNVNDFVDTMTVTTGNGSTNVFNAGDLTYAAAANAIGAETYDGSAYNGDQNLIFGGTQGRQASLVGATSYPGQTVLTGTGDDLIDLSYITTNTARTAAGYLTSTFLLNSTVNSAAGTDTVVLSADLADPRTVLLADPNFDDWFTNWDGVENLIVNGRNVTSSYVAYDWDAQAAGLQNISFTATDNSTTGNFVAGRLNNATIYLGYNYTGNAVPFVINSNVNTLQTIDSRSLVDIQANINNPVVSEVRIVSTGATLVGASDNDFELNYNNISSGLTIVGGATLAGPVNLAVENGSLDEVNFNGDIDGANVVSVTTSDALTAIGETTEYDFRGLVNNLADTTGSIVFDASAESNTPGLTIFGSNDGGTIAAGNVNNEITGTDGTFANGYGNDTIESGGFADMIDGLGGNDDITYSNTFTTLEVGNGVTVDGGSGNDLISVTANDGDAVVEVDGGIDDDDITVSTAGASTVKGNLGEDDITIVVQANSTNVVEAGENADLVTLTGSETGQVTIQQGLDDSNRAVTTDFGVNQIITAGDTMTFSNGVDVVVGFDTDIDVLLGDIRISRSLLGQDAAALVTSGWLSGEYDELTGRFTIAENGEGTDVAFIQFTDTVTSVNSNITTGVADRNQNILILQEVDSDDLQNSNFANAAGVGVNGINVIPLFSAGSLTLENGSWSPVLLNISEAGAFTPDDAVDPATPSGFSQSGLISVNLSNLGGSDTGADPSAGVKISLNGTTSTGLASVTGTTGDDEFVFASQVLGVGGTGGSGGVVINGLGGTNTLTFTTYNATSGGPLGNGDVGGTLINIDKVNLLGGTASGSGGLALDDSLTGIEVTNLSTGTAATVNLGTGAGNSFVGSAATGDVVTLGAASQTAEINSTSATITAGAGNVITANNSGNTTLTLSGTGSLAANYTATSSATADTLSFTGTSGATAIGGTYTGFEVISLTNSSSAGNVDFTLGSGTTGVTTLNLTYASAGTVGVSLSEAQAEALTAINLSGGTGTGGATITLEPGATVDFSNTTIADSSAGGSGVLTLALGSGTNEITLSVLQFNNASGEGFNAITAGTGLLDDNTLVLTGASGLTATGTTGNAPAGIDTIELGGNTAISINDSANAGVVREYIGNTAANTFTLGGKITAAKTVYLGDDLVTDTVVFDTGSGTGTASTSVTSIFDFTAGSGGDVVDIGVGSTGMTTIAGIVTVGATVAAAAVTGVPNSTAILAGLDFEIEGALTEIGDAGAVEAAIIAAQLNVTGTSSGTWVAGDQFYAVLDNGEDTGLYRVNISALGASGSGTVLDAANEFSVSLVGIINDISDAQTYVAANFV